MVRAQDDGRISMSRSHTLHVTGLIAAAAALCGGGCVVGPNFRPPAPPTNAGYTPAPLSATSTTAVAGAEAQRFVEAQDIPGEWWTLFHSQPLSDVIERSLAANPSLKAAQAALLVARENVLAQRGAYYPSVSGTLTASRSKTSSEVSATPNSGDLEFSLYTPQVSVSYVPDVFGLNRRTIESLKAQAQQTRFALAATHITLSANVVAAAIEEASVRGQIAATRALIEADTNLLQNLRDRYTAGYASELDVAGQELQLAQASATLPPLLKQLAQQRDLLAALSGGFPNQNLAETFELSNLQLPQELPVSLPAQLVEQRPDVRQAEESLHAASAQIGIGVANRLPSVALTANLGSMALAASSIFAAGTGIWDLSAGITQPIFEGGTLLHRERAARAAYMQAAEQYRSTVLTAFQNVADTLNALQQDADGLKAAAAAKDAANVTLDLATRQFQSGYVDNLALLTAELAYQQAALNLVQAQANRYADTAALFQALGGGWWHRSDIPQQ
jgi:NodT family efflux transporter outer membrane factor (OMF) lipoprotein